MANLKYTVDGLEVEVIHVIDANRVLIQKTMLLEHDGDAHNFLSYDVVPADYLSDVPPLPLYERRISTLRETISWLENEIARLRKEHARITHDVEQTQNEKDALLQDFKQVKVRFQCRYY